MEPRPPRHNRRVRFNIPTPPDSRSPPTSILRQPPPAPPSTAEQPAPFRRTSLPDMRQSSSHIAERRRRALVALKDMQNYLKEALNFHADDSRRALTPLSVNALSNLIAYLSNLRHDFNLDIIRRDEKLLQNVDIDPNTRHPAEQLHPNLPITNDYERYARNAHKKRLRREADHRLLQFVSKQLNLPPQTLRDLPPTVRERRELDAFKSRLKRFNTPTRTPHRDAPTAHPSPRHNSSAPSSPLDRPYTTPQSPHTDPPPRLRRAFELPNKGDELYPAAMAELRLPGSSFDQHHPRPAPQPSLRRANTPRFPTAQHPAHSTSPYTPVATSPYNQAPTSPYNQGPTSPYNHPPTSPYNHPPTSPYSHPPTSPYMLPTVTPSAFVLPNPAYHHHAPPPSTPPSAVPPSPYTTTLPPSTANYPPHPVPYGKTSTTADATAGVPLAPPMAYPGASAATSTTPGSGYNHGGGENTGGTRYPQQRQY